jgi:hypothetical protein
MTNPQPIAGQEPYGAVDAGWYTARVAADPWLFHICRATDVDAIRRQGLLPTAAGVAGQSHPGVEARPDAVYLGDRTVCREGWLNEWTGLHGDDAAVVAVGLRRIPAACLIPDEDVLNHEMLGDDYALDPRDFGLPRYDRSAWPNPGLWAAAIRMGAQPGIVEQSWQHRGTVAHLGPIPAAVLVVDADVPLPGTDPQPVHR